MILSIKNRGLLPDPYFIKSKVRIIVLNYTLLKSECQEPHLIMNTSRLRYARSKNNYPLLAICHVLLAKLYLFDHCGARLALFNPYFLRSFSRESRVKSPDRLSVVRKLSSIRISALDIPSLTASA